jgi:hypothetical protein
VAANSSQAISEIHNKTDARLTGTTKVEGTAVAVKASDDSDIESLSVRSLSGDAAAAAVGETMWATWSRRSGRNGHGHDRGRDPSSNDDGNDGLVVIHRRWAERRHQAIVVGGGSGKVAISGSVAERIKNVVGRGSRKPPTLRRRRDMSGRPMTRAFASSPAMARLGRSPPGCHRDQR